MISYNETKEKFNKQITDDLEKIIQLENAYESKKELYKKCLENIEILIYKNTKANKNYLFSIKKRVREDFESFNEQIKKISELKEDLTLLQKTIIEPQNHDKSVEKTAKLIYYGKLYKENSKKVDIIYGYESDWKKNQKVEMKKTEYGFLVEIELENFDTLNFCFLNELNRWDNNEFNNYTLDLKKLVFEYSDDKNYSIVIQDKSEEGIRNRIQQYNDKFKELKNFFFNISIYEENTMLKYVDTQMHEYMTKIVENQALTNKDTCSTKDNGTLLISEIQNKVVLPYTGEEVEEILKSNDKYIDADNVINDNFIKPLSYYKDAYLSRLRETYKLLTEKEDYTKLEATDLAFELFRKRYLHPAIISACKNLDELDVYLDCLSKNELDDFKIFDVKYELYPVVIKENKLSEKLNIFKRFIAFIKRIIGKSKQTGKRYN